MQHSLLLLVLLLLLAAAATAADETPRVEVVLVGATSSLARKYLFQSFFRAYLEEELKPHTDPTKVRLHLYGGATRDPVEGERLLAEYLEGSTSCTGLSPGEAQACEAALAAFRGKGGSEYVQLRGEGHYAELGRRLRTIEEEKGGEPLAGRCVLIDCVVIRSIHAHPRWPITYICMKFSGWCTSPSPRTSTRAWPSRWRSTCAPPRRAPGCAWCLRSPSAGCIHMFDRLIAVRLVLT